MKKLLEKLEKYFTKYDPVMILNTSTDRALVCLEPKFEMRDNMIFMHFNSLNDHGGNSVFIKSVQDEYQDRLYFDNEEDNILMLSPLNLINYKAYIQKQYFNAENVRDEDALKKYIKSQSLINV